MNDRAPVALAPAAAGQAPPRRRKSAKFALRPFFCPIEPAIHPAADAVERQSIEWLDRVRIHRDERQRARLVGSGSAEFSCRFAPSGREANLEVAAHWVYWRFAFDDARCVRGEPGATPAEFLAVAGPLQRALEAPWEPVAGDDRFVAALQDIGRDFQRCATPAQVRRFAEVHRAWLFGVAWQLADRARGRMPSLDEYTAMRLAGGAPTPAMLEIANGEEVPAAEMDSPVVRGLTEMAVLIASWDNDLHSHAVEADEDVTGQHLVNVLRAAHGRDTEQAVDEAYAMRDRVMSQFLHLRERRARPPASDALRRYLAGLGHAIRGPIDRALEVPRGNAVDGIPAQPPGPAHRIDGGPAEPSARPAGPLPIPAIAWWWDLAGTVRSGSATRVLATSAGLAGRARLGRSCAERRSGPRPRRAGRRGPPPPPAPRGCPPRWPRRRRGAPARRSTGR
jgi:hypothetical protein